MSVKQKQKFSKQRRENYSTMDPVKKRACLDNCAAKYANMGIVSKKSCNDKKSRKLPIYGAYKKAEVEY